MKLLAVRQDNNGDVLLCGPALRALAASASHLTLLCGPSGRAAAEALPALDDVLCAEAGWIEAHPNAPVREGAAHMLEALTRGRYDAAVIFTSLHQSPLPTALVLRLAGIGSIAAISRDYAGNLLDLRVREMPADLHEVERNLELARLAGFRLPPDDDRRLRMDVASGNPLGRHASYIVVHPGATVPARAWNPAKNRDLVLRLTERGERVVVTGGPSERGLCAFVAGTQATDLSGTTDFPALARVIADASALVAGNTGAAHVAAAVGTPVVSLFAPTIPAARFRPWMVEHALLGEQTIACAGCRARICPRETQFCLDDVGTDDVIDALALLRGKRVPQLLHS